MSYLVLARKSRPQLFEEVIGQEPVVRTLCNALQHNRVPHALIFSGVRGTGKTTLARIMAKALNCEQGPTLTPCNVCRSCREIMAGSSVDLQEVDGASNRGIQEIRELKEKIRFMPTASRFKIIIIDEVHMLTTEAFNALLKTLEEPPEHVYFMFATTELHKVPITILSRCQRYELKRVKRQELFKHFKALAAQEDIEVEDPAMHRIVGEAGGSVRDGLSLLDQVFSYCGAKVTAKDVTEVLGLIGKDVIASLAEALLQGDLDTALRRLDQVYSFGMNHKRFINEILDWFRSLIVFKISKKPAALLDLAEEEMALLDQTAGKYSAQTLMQVFALLLDPLEKAGYSNRPRFQIEMAMIRVVQVGDVVALPDLLERLGGMLGGLDLDNFVPKKSKRSVENITGVPQAQPAVAPPPEIKPPQQKNFQNETEPDKENNVTPKAVNRTEEKNTEELSKKRPLKKTEVITESTEANPTISKIPQHREIKDIRRHWDDFIDYVRDRKQWMALSLQRAKEARLENDELVIRYDDAADCRLLKNRDNIDSLTAFALDFFQGNFRIRFRVPDGMGCEIDPENGTGPRQERQALANDPLVLTALEIFNGQIGDIRVGPRFKKPMQKDTDSK